MNTYYKCMHIILYFEKRTKLPDGGIHPEGAEPLCLGGVGMREGGMSLSTNLYSADDSMTPPFTSELFST